MEMKNKSGDCHCHGLTSLTFLPANPIVHARLSQDFLFFSPNYFPILPKIMASRHNIFLFVAQISVNQCSSCELAAVIPSEIQSDTGCSTQELKWFNKHSKGC